MIDRRVFIGCRQFACWLKSICQEEAFSSEKLEEQCQDQQLATDARQKTPADRLIITLKSISYSIYNPSH
jgi:PIN domain nuclease of toxin-antitoxin system